MSDEPRYTMKREPVHGALSPRPEVTHWRDAPTVDGWYWVCKPGWIKNNPRFKYVYKVGDRWMYFGGDREIDAVGNGKMFHGPVIPPHPPAGGGEYWPPP